MLGTVFQKVAKLICLVYFDSKTSTRDNSTGFTIQWGNTSESSITFPKTFTDKPTLVITPDGIEFPIVERLDMNGFQLSGSQYDSISWISVGFS